MGGGGGGGLEDASSLAVTAKLRFRSTFIWMDFLWCAILLLSSTESFLGVLTVTFAC